MRAGPRARPGVLARLRELAAFGAVGLLALGTDLGLFNLLRLGPGLGPMTSKTLAVVVATTVAYLGNRWWTFRHRGRRRLRHEYALFVVLNVAGLGIALACLGVSHYLLGLTSPLADNVAANVVGLGLGTAFRFWSYRRYVFPEPAVPAGGTAPAIAPQGRPRLPGTAPGIGRDRARIRASQA